MPIYEFIDERTGKPAEVLFASMEGPDGPPSIGDMIPGTKLRRTFSRISAPCIRDFRFKGISQKDWASGAPAYDKTGTPCFTSKGEIQKYVDHQNGLVDKDGVGETGGEYIAYDASPNAEDLQTMKREGRAKRPSRNAQSA